MRVQLVLCAAAIAACSGSAQVQQSITGVSPAIVNPGAPTTMVIDGRFETVAGGASTVALIRTRSLDGTADGSQVASLAVTAQASGVASSVQLSLTPPVDAATGVYGFRITSAAGHSVSIGDGFVLVPPASAGALTNDVACLDGTAPLLLSAPLSNFYTLGTDAPGVFVLGPEGQVNATASVGGCQPIRFSPGVIQTCSSAFVSLPANAPAGSYTVRLATTTGNGTIGSTIEQPVVIDRPDPLDVQPQIYSAADGDARIQFGRGRTFHVAQAAPPVASIDGQAVEAAFDGCTPAAVPGHSFCTQLTLPLPRGTPAGTHTVAFTTMPGCTATATAQSIDAPAPIAAHSDDPSLPAGVICPDAGRFVVVDGAGFYRPRAFVDGQLATTVQECPESPPGACNSFRFLPTLLVGPSAVPIAPGTHTVTVENQTAPPVRRTVPTALVVDPGPPQAGTPEPALVFDGLDRQIFVPIAAQARALSSVTLLGPGFASLPATFSAAPGGVAVAFPAGLATGVWSIAVRDQGPCPAAQASFVTVVSDFVYMHRTFDAATDTVPVLFDGDTFPSSGAELVPNGTGLAPHFAASAGSPPWWFVVTGKLLGPDLATLRFDLRRSGTGLALPGGDVRLSGPHFQLETTLSPAPGDAWTHYDVSLGDPTLWTFIASDGSTRPATSADVLAVLADSPELRIRGSGFDGDTDASLDELVLELAH